MEKKITLDDGAQILKSVDIEYASKFYKKISAVNYILFNAEIIHGFLGNIEGNIFKLYYLKLAKGTELDFPLKGNGDWVLVDGEYLESLSNSELLRVNQEIDNFKKFDYERRKSRRHLANQNKSYGESPYSEEDWECLIQEEIQREWVVLEEIYNIIKQKLLSKH
ncbi:hypothetical protein [Neisseria wadsworthii]|uniref:hypothetical protein n=1 Tax=Neisseria wadsworthii TaxID=607711 RepID=UPI000D3090BC|nr:hypothetical protein [Neisseria wadsworthii]